MLRRLFIMSNISNSRTIGEIKLFPVDTPPAHTLVCNGAELSIAAYPELYAVIGTKYGGNGTTTFRLPDTEDRFPRFAGGGLAVGEKQGDAIRNIEGYLHNLCGNGTDTTSEGCFNSSAGEVQAYAGPGTVGTFALNWFTGHLNANLVVPTADENRPKAIALLACIIFE